MSSYGFFLLFIARRSRGSCYVFAFSQWTCIRRRRSKVTKHFAHPKSRRYVTGAQIVSRRLVRLLFFNPGSFLRERLEIIFTCVSHFLLVILHGNPHVLCVKIHRLHTLSNIHIGLTKFSILEKTNKRKCLSVCRSHLPKMLEPNAHCHGESFSVLCP